MHAPRLSTESSIKIVRSALANASLVLTPKAYRDFAKVRASRPNSKPLGATHRCQGLTQKHNGLDAFLDDHPEQQNKVVLILISVPSREGVKEYKELETKLCTSAGNIDGKHGKSPSRIAERYTDDSATPDRTPLLYLHCLVPFNELTALYYVADVCCLTSTGDGMNRLAFEYVACQQDRHGALVLSEFAGTVSFVGIREWHHSFPSGQQA
ncbi:Alpha-alpha-trehalose-phosphate synthase subunit [Penicillium sp. DV-2018c]|nr:Alpha-alpha-trehalose-phosphate synthase subunit [Penicillium sp. DV-2018c]